MDNLNNNTSVTDAKSVRESYQDNIRWELVTEVIRSIEDYLDYIIYIKDIFSDERWSVPTIIDVAGKGYAELKQTLDKIFLIYNNIIIYYIECKYAPF